MNSNFNIIQYEKQSASFNHQLNSEICCLCVVKCVVGGPNHPNPRWRRPTIRLPELCTLLFGVFFGQHISHQFLQQTFFSAHIFNILFILTLVATKYFFQFYSSPPPPPDIKWCVPYLRPLPDSSYSEARHISELPTLSERRTKLCLSFASGLAESTDFSNWLQCTILRRGRSWF